MFAYFLRFYVLATSKVITGQLVSLVVTLYVRMLRHWDTKLLSQ